MKPTTMSKSDDMFLDNLDEFVNDENLLITYKRLSVLLKVHVNQAKQMLYAFVNHQRNNKENDQLNVTYFVAGLSNPVNGVRSLKCMVVPEENLEAFKSTLSVITSSHIYSVSKAKVKDEHDIYSAEYESVQKDGIFNTNEYSSIKYQKAKVCSEAEIKSIREKSQSTQPKQVNGSCKTEKENGHVIHKPTDKPPKVKGIAGMFASQAKKTENKIVENGDKKDEPSKTEKITAKDSSNNKKGGVMAFFSKQTAKSNVKPSEPTKKETPKQEQVKKEPSPSPPKRKSVEKSKGKRSKPSEESDDDNQKKRKRIKAAIIDSSSEEEMDYESPIPSPVREPSPDPESPIPKEVKSPVKKSPEKSTETGEKKRRRRRKLVPKTFMDEDGYMVTEKVWESESTDASETEAPPKKPQTKQPTPQKKKASPKKKSPPSAKSGKQAALTSFFKKK